MKFYHQLRLMALLIISVGLLQPSPARAAEGAKDAQTLMNGMRLKKWTKDLELTPEQQKKVQSILDEEGKEITKLDQDSALDINSRKAKVTVLRQATYAKMKPILHATQLETFEKSLTKTPRKK